MKVVLAGGGTAGHVNPMLVTAELLQRRHPEVDLLVLGTAEGLEAQLVPAAGLSMVTIPKVPFPRSVGGQALRFPARFRSAVNQARAAIGQFEADVVVGFGGYVATPAYLAARRLELPLVVHEANARTGLANQLGARYATAVATTFPGTKLSGAVVTGLPMRPALATLDRPAQRTAARAELGLDPQRPCLLVSGGSLGAQHLNQALADLAGELLANGAQVLHLTGKGKAEVLHEALAKVDGAQHYHIREYLDRMELAMAAADLAVCRAGAGTVCELACAALPSVLVPLAIGNGEQRHNAAELVQAGGAEVVADATFPKWAAKHLVAWLGETTRLSAMTAAAGSVARRDGAERLVDLIEQAARGGLKSHPTGTQAEPTPGKDQATHAKSQRRFHLMGVGGVGMAAVAELGKAKGWQVSGCDGVASPTLEHLADLGVPTQVGHDPAHLAAVTTMVVSSAIKPDNPELVAARRAGLEVWHRSQALAALARSYRLLAVAGTHGKTTTAAMAAKALAAAGLDPAFAIGAEVLGHGSGAYLGHGEVMVIEADESDGSFLNYHPEVAVVTNVEADHLDHYGDEAAMVQAFQRFVGQAGTVVLGVDDPGAGALAKWAEDQGIAVVGYGLSALSQVVLEPLSGGAVHLSGAAGGERIDLSLNLPGPGWHLRLDAAAALLGAVLLGASPAAAAKGLAAYGGTGRRFEQKAKVGSIKVFDDYAHHPTEITATVAAARQVAPGRLLVVFQPHLYSRTKAFAAQFAQALALADQVWVMDVYGAREAPMPGVSGALITDQMDPAKARFVPERSAVAGAVAAAAMPDDLIITMGAGDVTALAEPIAAALAQRSL